MGNVEDEVVVSEAEEEAELGIDQTEKAEGEKSWNVEDEVVGMKLRRSGRVWDWIRWRKLREKKRLGMLKMR